MIVASFGGGTDSTAMLIGMWQRKEPIDLILFADTGGEKPHTYQHVRAFSPWLVDHGMPEILTVKKVRHDGTIYSLEQNCIDQKMLPSIAYGYKSCSLKYKVAPQDKYCNNWQPTKDAWKRGEKVIKLIGYEAGEERRAKIMGDDKYTYRYPLIEWGWDRAKCVQVILEAGLPLPGKSACFFCPSSKAQEVKQLAKQYPDLAARAIAMEKNAVLTDIKGLGRNFAWADLLAFDEAQVKMFDEDWSTAEVPCGCYDG